MKRTKGRPRKPIRHLILPDTQVKDKTPNEHIIAAANYAIEHQVEKIICLGDWWDMPSLSTYDDMKSAEGKRVMKDIESGNSAMQKFMDPLVRARKKSKKWTPSMDFLLGNHCQRIERSVGVNAKLEGLLGYHLLNLGGWKVHDFLKVVNIDGIHYSHYFANPMTGKPYSGDAKSILNKLGYSFVMGHRQVLEHSRKDLTNGKVIQGLIAGAFYQHDEGYKGHQGNNHYRGMCILHDVRDGEYDLEIMSIDRLIRSYT